MAASGGLSRETQMSIDASSKFPGFRFSPTDVELISYYLKKKIEGDEKCVEVISEIDICRYEPWDLPVKSVIQSETEWFFFSARGRKYPNGTQSRRATELGYWKATGKERNVKSGSTVVGTKRTLVFHVGRAPRGERTEWIMHEYCMHGISQDSLVVCRLRKNTEFRLNDASNRASANQRRLSSAKNNSNSTDAVSEGCTDQVGVPDGGGEKAAECSKRCSSSNDSYSIEQFSSASENEQKLSNDVTLAASSNHQMDSDNDEDFYAEILKDDIIKLDETSLTTPPQRKPQQQVAMFLPEPLPLPPIPIPLQGPAPEHPFEVFASQPLPLRSSTSIPLQGTANQRIRFKEQMPGISQAEETKSPRSDDQEFQSCFIGLFTMTKVNKAHIRLGIRVLVILTLLVLLASMLGGFQQVKRITYATVHKASWPLM